ncbi:MAG: MoxR family ATPase [Candidatus Wallbacteria bacterium]|nr:MoxR family ATPase [Candidatus Wallbacteria bacterium]
MDEKKLVELVGTAREEISSQLARNVVGQEKVIERIMLALFCQGHCLLEGVPGLAKTMLVRSLGAALDLRFGRIQFTPDLMPSDIIGSELIEENQEGKREFRFHKGPLFANLVLADEINRTPPKTQSALLEAMQEHAVTVNGVNYPMEKPFLVLATQNPIEQEGTYPLPEAQLDRFLFYLKMSYPSQSEEEEVVRRMTSRGESALTPVLDAGKIMAIQQMIYHVPVADEIVAYAVRVARSTRPHNCAAGSQTAKMVEFGVSPRAVQWLVLAAKALSLVRGRTAPGYDEIKELIPDVFRHRIVLNFQAEAEGVSTDDILTSLIDEVK